MLNRRSILWGSCLGLLILLLAGFFPEKSTVECNLDHGIAQVSRTKIWGFSELGLAVYATSLRVIADGHSVDVLDRAFTGPLEVVGAAKLINVQATNQQIILTVSRSPW